MRVFKGWLIMTVCSLHPLLYRMHEYFTMYWMHQNSLFLAIKKNFGNSRLKAKNLQILEITKTIYSNSERWEKFLVKVLGVYNFMSWLLFDCMTCLNFWACPANQSSSKIYFANIPYTLLNNYTISPVTYLLVYLINVMFVLSLIAGRSCDPS